MSYMDFTSETVVDGVVERAFELSVQGERVPGVVWTALGASRDLPVVLMGHGASQHKRAPAVVGCARSFVTTLEIAVAAIDAPGHGDRPSPAHLEQFRETLKRKIAQAEPIGLDVA